MQLLDLKRKEPDGLGQLQKHIQILSKLQEDHNKIIATSLQHHREIIATSLQNHGTIIATSLQHHVFNGPLNSQFNWPTELPIELPIALYLFEQILFVVSIGLVLDSIAFGLPVACVWFAFCFSFGCLLLAFSLLFVCLWLAFCLSCIAF